MKLEDIINIDNEKYIIKDIIFVDKIPYYLLINKEKNYDFIIRKTNKLSLLENELEFNEIYNIFSQRNAF